MSGSQQGPSEQDPMAITRESLPDLGTLLRRAPVGMAVLDRECRFLCVNDKLAEMNGIPAEAHTGRHAEAVLPEGWPEIGSVVDQVLRAPAATAEQEFTTEHPGEPGATRSWRATWYPVEARDGVAAVAVMVEDVTPLRRAEAGLTQAVASRDEFLSFVSHELRGPLTIIQGYASLLSKRADLNSVELWRTAIDEMFQETARLNEILSNLLAMARLDQGKQVTLGPLVLDTALRRVVDEFQELSSRQVSLLLPEGPTTVRGNEGLLSQVVRNLLSNAEKYSPEGSPIAVEARDANDCEVLAVMDQGEGFEERDAEKLFEPFYRGPESHRRPGLGIGLTVSRRLVDIMGGEIWVETKRGVGSTFFFTLPKYIPLVHTGIEGC
jgi:PAS domain S-box-containing protein